MAENAATQMVRNIQLTAGAAICLSATELLNEAPANTRAAPKTSLAVSTIFAAR